MRNNSIKERECSSLLGSCHSHIVALVWFVCHPEACAEHCPRNNPTAEREARILLITKWREILGYCAYVKIMFQSIIHGRELCLL